MASDRFVCNASGPLGAPLSSILVGFVSAIVLSIVAFAWVRENRPVSRAALTIIFAGGFGNLYDRVLYGCVSDYAFVPWFPAFNLSDVMLTVGGIMWCIQMYANTSNSTHGDTKNIMPIEV